MKLLYLNLLSKGLNEINNIESSEKHAPEGNIKIDKKEAVKASLDYLSGHNPLGVKIMEQEDFHNLLEYTYHLVEKDEVPENIKRLRQINIPNRLIIYTYYLLHQKLYTTKSIRGYFIDFLKAVFIQLNGTEKSTLKTKFSTRPSSYEADMKKMSR
ncbi:hypothetical protein GU926_01965 [Nibribacter ruber]|uniref:Uncharacterized protein n=1 Tax=Nibribacter ruber TaxID=2698458 RepID=A0A6P1NWU3_9BACT|nr:hypothetical protein [Nibribacter ruber]QHL86275.1 hypothetical protein GU926_01965 [Nibribacter ruber]